MDMELEGVGGFNSTVSTSNHVFVLHVLNFAEFLETFFNRDWKIFLYDPINKFFVVS